MLIIGITGTLGAGKGTIVEELVRNHGFTHFSVRSFLLQEIDRLGLPPNRDSMVNVANRLRSEHSPWWIVEQLYRKALSSGKNCIIESIRTPGEAEMLRGTGNFILMAVDADPVLRYRRIVSRASETDRIDFEEFCANEQREMESDDPNHQNLKKCIEMADVVFTNNDTVAELAEKVNNFLKMRR